MTDKPKSRKGCGCIAALVLFFGFVIGGGAILLALVGRNVEDTHEAVEHSSEARLETSAPATTQARGESSVKELTDVPPPAPPPTPRRTDAPTTPPITQDVDQPYDAPEELINPQPPPTPRETAPTP